jgi:hypothetical protein
MSSSVTGRFSSGSMTLLRASVICSRVGCSTLRGYQRSGGEPLPQQPRLGGDDVRELLAQLR